MSAICVHGLTKSFTVKHKQAGMIGSLQSLFKPQLMEEIITHIYARTGKEAG